MNRRGLDRRSLSVACVAALVPWKLPAPTRAMGGPVPPGVTYIIGNGDHEHFAPNTEWYTCEQPLTFQHSATVKSAAVLDLGETIILESTDGKYAITRDGGATWEEIDTEQAQREREYYTEIVYTFSEGSHWG